MDSPPLRGPGQTVEGRGGHVTPHTCLPGRPQVDHASSVRYSRFPTREFGAIVRLRLGGGNEDERTLEQETTIVTRFHPSIEARGQGGIGLLGWRLDARGACSSVRCRVSA